MEQGNGRNVAQSFSQTKQAERLRWASRESDLPFLLGGIWSLTTYFLSSLAALLPSLPAAVWPIRLLCVCLL